MDLKLIVIIALVGFGWYWYANPTEGHELIEDGVDKAKSLIPVGGFEADCPTTINPVCDFENGVTYDNSCLAGEAGVLNATLGACDE